MTENQRDFIFSIMLTAMLVSVFTGGSAKLPHFQKNTPVATTVLFEATEDVEAMSPIEWIVSQLGINR